jgi:hypothetical protein
MERHVGSQGLRPTFQNADGDQGGSTFGSGGGSLPSHDQPRGLGLDGVTVAQTKRYC